MGFTFESYCRDKTAGPTGRKVRHEGEAFYESR